MTQVVLANHPPGLAEIAIRYPEKTFLLGQVFNDTTNSYKLFWFLAILSLLKQSQNRSLALEDIFTEMAVAAWYPVCLYRMSLGRQDKLQDAVLDIQIASGLSAHAVPEDVRRFVQHSTEARARLDYFKRYVPTRFLSPWFAGILAALRDDLVRTRETRRLALESQKSPMASPYYFDGTGARSSIRINDSWHAFLIDNLGVVQLFAEHSLAIYLQARNPNVPGVVNKLRAPTERRLTVARDFWEFVREVFNRTGKTAQFRDIYSGRPLAEKYSIDHFLPWSFVVHDLLWNLTPVDPVSNSRKNDAIPDLDVYLPRLAKLHFAALGVAKRRPRFLENYTDCFKDDADELLGRGEDRFVARYREVILPQALIATNLGFQPDWVMRTQAPSLSTEDAPLTARGANRTSGKPIQVQELLKSPEIEIQRFPNLDSLPFYSLEIAAGGFLGGDAPEAEGWIDVARFGFTKRLSKEMFVTRVVGESMYPTIKNGSYCVFRWPVEGSRQGRVLLVQRRNMEDPETGGSYTVKRYRSSKSVNEAEWRHESIQLVPDNPDRARFPVLGFVPEDAADLRVIAEFVQMLAAT
jgi:hypothetical protein